MFVVVCYDIPDDKRRNKVAQALKGFGYRVQKSVFECEVNQDMLKKMRLRVEKRLKPEEDSVRYYNLCQACLGKTVIVGLGQVERDRPFFVV